MNKIKILPDNLANQIAAGEVVERPASVVKELIENALDAGARRIQIDIELGGRRLMRVSDDGGGMSRDDAILAFERHATSKIKSLEDLGKIETLGFRGEALASIASVAKVELTTKTAADEAATKVIIEGGKLLDVKDAARNTGTTISVRDLFFNTPARRKFMRSEATENFHLANIVTHYALANFAAAFTLTNNGRDVLRVSPAQDLRERAHQIFGAQMIESLLKVEGGREFVAKISGYVSAPRMRRTTRDAQYFFINGRFVRDKIISGGLLEGFRSVLPHGVYPVAFLFLEIPFEEVDVNVHPAKTEVRFRRTEAVKETIGEAIRQTLQKEGIQPTRPIFESRDTPAENFPDQISDNNYFPIQNAAPVENRLPEQPKIEFQTTTRDNFSNNQSPAAAPIESNTSNEATKVSETNQPTAPIQTETFNPFASFAAAPEEISSSDFESQAETRLENSDEIRNPQSAIGNPPPPFDSAAKIPKSVEPETLSASRILPVSQLHDSFIIAVDDEGLLLIDQHVAHERILFDKFRRKETERKIESQNLLLPETIDLTPAQSIAFDLIETELENLGFALMKLSGRTIAVKAVPTDLPAREVRNFLAEILDTVDREKFGKARADLRDNIAASLACKAAVKINMKLTNEKMQWLIDNLLFTSSPTTCPHGRPVILRLTMRDIERGFHRP